MKLISLILAFILSFSAFAEECVQARFEDSSMMTLTKDVNGIIHVSCPNKDAINFTGVATGCLTNGRDGALGVAAGIAYFFKLLFWDVPYSAGQWLGEKAASFFTPAEPPSRTAGRMATANMQQNKSLWQKATDYYNSFINFATKLGREVSLGMEGTKCLSLRQITGMVCKGVSEVFFGILTPAIMLKGINVSAALSQRMTPFIRDMKHSFGLDNASLLTKFQMNSARLQGHELIINTPTAKLFEVPLRNGNTQLRYTRLETNTRTGKRVSVTYDVPKNAVNGAIDAKTEIGRAVLDDLVKEMQTKGTVVFIDANHLGKVNYAEGGTVTGDRYLSLEANAIRRQLRDGDMIFNNGGDELIVILNTRDPSAVRNITQRMSNAVNYDRDIREIFRREVIRLKESYVQVNNTNSFAALPASVRAGLNQAELSQAQKNFGAFKSQWLSKQLTAIQDQSMYKGSISIGASAIRSGENLSTVQMRAEAIAAQVKSNYKASYGFDASKYGINQGQAVLRRRGAPQALDPN